MGLLTKRVNVQNHSTETFILTLRQISVLNNLLVKLPVQLASLQTAFRDKSRFVHIQRLHNMIYVYGVTLIEIVRRKEFGA